MKLLKLLVCSALAVLLVSAAHGQSTVGTIYGSVVDANGAKVPGATVTITDVKTSVKQINKSNGQGDYQFVAVNPSDYSVTVAAATFKTETQTGVTVDANSNVNVSFTLQAGGADETLEVSALTTLVDTREAQIGETISQARIEELPTINRDPYQLLQTVPGGTGFTADILVGSRAGAQFSINGLPATTSSYYLDGSQNNILRTGGGNKAPNPSALQEFRILTSNFDAEFGRSPGAVLNLITKSGTDRYHGELYEFIRNNAFDAKNYFSVPGQIVNFKQNQFGGTAGGPIPKLSKTFFFVSFEHLQLHQDLYIYPSQYQTVTPAEAAGDFTLDPALQIPAGANATTTKLIQGYQAAVMSYSCNGLTYVLCPSKVDPVAANVIKFLPLANPVTGAPPLESGPADNLVNQGLIRIDYNGFQRHSIEGTFFDSRGSATDPTAGGTNQVFSYEGVFDNNNQINGILADNWIVNNNMVNSGRFFYTGNRSVITNQYPNHLLPDLGAAIPDAAPRYLSAPPRWSLGNGEIQIGPQTYGPSDINQQQFGIVDVVTLTKGRHSIKVGGSYIWDKYAEQGTNYSGGYFNITSDQLGVGDRFIDFLLGRANTYEQSTPAEIHRHNFDPALFAQDDWHLLSRLTLNLGARWEMYPPFQGDGTSGTFRAGVQSTRFPTAPLGILYEGDKGVAPGIANTPLTDFAPRVGFAWDVYGDGRTSLRGGYGIFFYQQVVDDENRYQQPFGLSETINPSPLQPSYANPFQAAGLTSPFPYIPNLTNPIYASAGTVYATPANGGSTPYAQEYNLTVEQQLGKTYAVRISYIGNTFIKQLQDIDLNTAIPPTNQQIINSSTAVKNPSPISAALQRRPYEPYNNNGTGYPYGGAFYFQAIQELKNELNNNYNSLQVTLRGRLGRQINLNSSYVWSKTLNNASPVNQLDPRSSYGPASTDIRHRFVLSGLFGLPQVHRYGWVGKEVLSGWRLNDITYVQTGGPFNITTATDENYDGNTGDRPDIICDPYTHNSPRAANIHEYLNPACFATTNPASGSASLYGNEERNGLHLPYTAVTNVSAFKEFTLPRETRLQFRAEAFNVFNKVNLYSPRTDFATVIGSNEEPGGTVMPGNLTATSNLANPAFAELQSAQTARQLQFGLRFIF